MPPRGVRKGTKRARQYEHVSGLSSERRGGLRSGTRRPRERTFARLYEEARALGVEGRSKMRKAELERAVEGRKRRR